MEIQLVSDLIDSEEVLKRVCTLENLHGSAAKKLEYPAVKIINLTISSL